MYLFPIILIFGSLIISAIVIICIWFTFKRTNPYHTTELWNFYTDETPKCISRYI